MGLIIKNNIVYNGAESEPIIYSEEEREVGVWTDGRPLYQKTINFGSLPSSGEKSVAHNISNLDRIVSCVSIAKNSNDISIQIPYVNAGNDRVGTYITNTNITIGVSSNLSAYTDTQVTIQYTKNTDTPGSGTWTPSGVKTVHYNENEQVVGTWIDGSTIYEKTIALPQVYVGSGSVADIATLTNIDYLIDAHGTAIENDVTYQLPEPGVRIKMTSNNVLQFACLSGSWDISSGYVTIRYTKTAS